MSEVQRDAMFVQRFLSTPTQLVWASTWGRFQGVYLAKDFTELASFKRGRRAVPTKRTTYMKGKVVFPHDNIGGSYTMNSNKCHIDLVSELKCDYHSIEIRLVIEMVNSEYSGR